MLVEYDGRIYSVKFEHKRGRVLRSCTICTIEPENRNIRRSSLCFSKEIAVCSKGDNFSKKIGRKIALTRALARYPREVRKVFWAEYWKHHKK